MTPTSAPVSHFCSIHVLINEMVQPQPSPAQLGRGSAHPLWQICIYHLNLGADLLLQRQGSVFYHL